MAPRKTTTRKKRSARGKSSGQSATAVLTVGAIVVMGAAALWATSQSKSPSTSFTSGVSGLFRNVTTTPSGNAANSASERRTTQTSVQAKTRTTESSAALPAPVRRPPLDVGQVLAADQQHQSKQMALLTPRTEAKPVTQPVTVKPAQPHATPALPPVGKTAPDDNSRHASGAFKVPKVIIAKQALVIREKAWDQAKTVGSVEKGREMRSYAKVGRWHRVVVPSTNIIGWVQEDQLAFKNQQRHSSPLRAALTRQSTITTGSIRQKQTAKPQNTRIVTPVYPQQPVGKKQN